MKILKTSLILLTVFLLKSNPLWSQKLISDSLILDLKYTLPETLQIPIKIDTVLDLRNVDDPVFIAIDEINHYGVVPVDLFIKTKKPLNKIIQQTLFFKNTIKDQSLSLGTKHFEFSKHSKLLLFRKYQLKALIKLYHQTNSDSLLAIGELIFNTGTTKFFINAKLKKEYENVFCIWCQELTKNLNSVSQHLGNNQNPLPYNFRFSQLGLPWMQFFTGAEIILLQKGFLIDGYLTFVYPETKRLFNKSAGTLRFRRDKKFDSIEYGLVNSSLNYRLNSKIFLRFKYDLFLGINRWKDMNVKKHKVYDALIGDLSFSQSLIFHPIHKKTLFVGFGFFQDVYYIYSKNFQFQPGLIINAGLQL